MPKRPSLFAPRPSASANSAEDIVRETPANTEAVAAPVPRVVLGSEWYPSTSIQRHGGSFATWRWT